MSACLSVLSEFLWKSVAEEKLALDNLMDSFGEILGCARLENVAADTGFKSSGNIVVIAMDAQDDGSSIRNGFSDSACCFYSIQTRH